MSRRPRPLDIAIVGMACRFPGADDLFAFWENMLANRPAIGDVPAGRWDAETYYDPASNKPGRVSGRRGGYLQEPIELDASAFGIMPRTVEGGEPEQFLVLDAARSALDDAGLLDRMPERRRVEVVIGRGNYFNRGNLTRLQHGRVLEQTLGILRSLHPEWTESDIEAVREDLRSGLPPFEAATIPGQLTNAVAGRIADRFDLAGASFVVDAASASALVAVDLGAQALQNRRADLALVGGVYLEVDVDFPLVFSRLGVLSKSGASRPFSEDADGMVPGEGVGVVVLKRLADAERDGNRVYAVLKGIGLASDGRGAGLAAPHARGHLRAIRHAYRRSGVDPATVGYLEGHGLGAPAADRAELRALRAAFPPSDRGRILGASSALVGHAMPAAGMAGLIKTALCLHHRMLPPSPGADSPHRLLKGSGISLNATPRPWIIADGERRRAGVNAFGFAGINAHAVLEEHPESADGVTPGAMRRWPTEAILIAAQDRPAISNQMRRLAEVLRNRRDIDLKDLAATLAEDAIADEHSVRVGLVVESIDDLVARLEALAPRIESPATKSIRDARGSYFWAEPLGREGGLACMFPGEGSQYPGMLADLCPHFPEIRHLFDVSDRLALEAGATEPPSEMLFGASKDSGKLWESDTAVNLVLSSQWAIYSLLLKLGLSPSAVVGHSSGEFLALAAAGAIQVDRGLEDRFGALGAVFARLDASGMVAPARLLGVATSRERVEAVLGDQADRIAIVADNCPHQVILAGSNEAIEVVAGRLRKQGALTEDLPFGRAYHTPAFAPAVGPIAEFFATLDIAPLTKFLYSCCTTKRFPQHTESIRELGIAQWTRPVEFRRTMEAMHSDGLRLFVDVGARGNLAGFTEDILRSKPSFSIAANLPRRSGLTQINHVVASLFAQGVSLQPQFLYARRRPERLDLAALPTARKTFPLAVGFPEMQFSTELIEKYRAKPAPVPSAELATETTQPPPFDNEPQQSSIAPISPADSPAPAADADEAMLSYLGTMERFARTQQAIMAGYLDATPDGQVEDYTTTEKVHVPSAAGIWAGEVRRLEPGRSVEAVLTLDANGDPVAEHHTFGGRRVSALDPEMRGLPVLPFTVMAEMLVQAAAHLSPGRIVTGLRDVRARRWIRYEDSPIPLEVVAEADPEEPGAFRASLFNRGKAGLGDVPEVEGVVIFGDRRETPPEQQMPALAFPETSRFTAHSMYTEQWLFHGPALRAVSEVGPISDGGIDGTLRVLPRNGLARDRSAPRPLTDPIVLDAFTHLLGVWGLDRLPEGDVVFPLRLGRLDIFGEDPSEGADCPCRIRVKAIERHRVVVDAEILLADGSVWMRLTDWEDWRFYWPSRYRDVFRAPDHILLGEPLTLPGVNHRDAVAVWLEPPADMGRPVWRDVLEQTQLSPEERSGPLRPTGHEGRRSLRLWGRIAAKEAARRLWLIDGGPALFPVDLSILPDQNGRPIIHSRAQPTRGDMPAVSIAHTEGVAIALATRNPADRVGIDVEKIVERAPSFEAVAFSEQERTLLDRCTGERSEWIARFWCAKEAAAKATGLALIAGPMSVEVTHCDADGEIEVTLGTELALACPDLGTAPLLIRSERRGDYIWAWTIAEGPPTRPRTRRRQLMEVDA